MLLYSLIFYLSYLSPVRSQVIAADGSVSPLYLVTPEANIAMVNRFTCIDTDPDNSDRLYGGGIYTSDAASNLNGAYTAQPRGILGVKATTNDYSDEKDWKWFMFVEYSGTNRGIFYLCSYTPMATTVYSAKGIVAAMA